MDLGFCYFQIVPNQQANEKILQDVKVLTQFSLLPQVDFENLIYETFNP